MASGEAQRYRIGLVSRLSGVPVATIRMWERRYGLTSPERTAGGARLYGEQDVARLSLVRRAAEQGHAIGTIVRLSIAELRERLAACEGSPAQGRLCRVAVIGAGMRARMREACDGLPAVQLAAGFDDPSTALRDLPVHAADVVVADCPSLQPADADVLLELVAASKPRMLIVVYGFSSQRTLRSLDRDRILVFRAPVEAAQLVRASLIGLNVPLPCLEREYRRGEAPHTPRARRYTDAQLARLSALAASVRCECPRHIGDLLTNLHAFEQYSAQCADAGPEDAALHRMIRLSAEQARILLEDALGDVLRAERIDPDRV